MGKSTIDISGKLIQRGFARSLSSWLPSSEDKCFINSLMYQVLEPGETAIGLISLKEVLTIKVLNTNILI